MLIATSAPGADADRDDPRAASRTPRARWFQAPPSPPPTSARSIRRNAVTDGAGSTRCGCCRSATTWSRSTLPGFKNFTQTGIVLEVGRNARVDATIELGAVSETVSVVGDSPLVDTASASLSRTVGQNEVLNLPLVNRDLYPLLSITGGVTSNTSSNSLGGPEQVTTINGSGAAQMGTRQLPARWRQQHRGPARHRQPGAEPGSGAGIPRADQRLLGRVRPLLGGRRRHRHQVGDEHVSRRRLRFHPQREVELAALGAAGNGRHQRPARS